MSMSSSLDSLATNIGEHLPDILLGTSLASGAAATIYGIAITPSAMDDILAWVIENTTEQERRGLKLSELHRLIPFKMKVRLLWKKYLPVAFGMGVSIGTGIGAEVLNDRKSMAYATLASAAEIRLRDFTASTREVVGEHKYDEIEAKTAQKTVDRTNTVDNTYYVNRKTEGFMVIDDITHRRYVVDRDQLDKIQGILRDHQRAWDFVPLNDFYEALGVPISSIGWDIGWDIRDGYVRFAEDMRGGLYEGEPIGVLNLSDQLSMKLPGGERAKFR